MILSEGVNFPLLSLGVLGLNWTMFPMNALRLRVTFSQAQNPATPAKPGSPPI